jgi:hypothetical protein
VLLHPSTGGGRPAGESTGCMITRYTNDRYRKSMVLVRRGQEASRPLRRRIYGRSSMPQGELPPGKAHHPERSAVDQAPTCWLESRPGKAHAPPWVPAFAPAQHLLRPRPR